VAAVNLLGVQVDGLDGAGCALVTSLHVAESRPWTLLIGYGSIPAFHMLYTDVTALYLKSVVVLEHVLEIEYCTALLTCRGRTDPTGGCFQPVCACACVCISHLNE
jgi:hypothetical protein